MDNTNTTSVFKKPEFWMTLVTSVCGMLIAFGVLTPEQSDSITRCVSTVVGAVVALLSSFKFVGAQHAAKVEVFRAMCVLQTDRDGKFTAQNAESPAEAVAKAARSVGL